MAIGVYYKIAGAWTPVVRPYVKRAGVWTPVNEVWRKESGAWVRHFLWDVTPPPPPTLSLDLVTTGTSGRFISVGVSIPGSHNPNVKMIRVLYSTTAYPATQFGGTYSSSKNSQYPDEPWSDWYYGPGTDHPVTNVVNYKDFPNNHTTSSNLSAGTYYFQAWTLDINGNWSVGDYIQMTVPKQGLGSNVVLRSARIQATASGTWVTGTGFVTGDLIQGVAPRAQRGMYFYGSEFSVVGSTYGDAHATITQAQVYLSRKNDDGSPTANVYMFRHGYSSAAGVPAEPTGPTINEITKIGTISKGESKWLSLPTSMYSDIIDGTALGFGFYYKDPAKASAQPDDYSELSGLTETWRTPGQVFLAWTESPG